MKVRPFLKHRRCLSLKKWFLQKPVKPMSDIFNSFLCLLQMKLSLHNKTGVQIRCKSSFSPHTKDDKAKVQTVKSVHNTGQAS